MPYAGMPVVQDGVLQLPDGQCITLDSPEWFAWLDAADAFSYPTSQPGFRLTVRKEERRNHFYWYAYLKHASKLHNVYVGRSDTLTQERLEEVAKHLIAQLT